MTGKEVLHQLGDLNINFESTSKEGDWLNTDFRFASIKKKIDQGIYYLVVCSEELLADIKDSMIITTKTTKLPEDNSSNNIFVLVDNPQLAHYKLSALLEPAIVPGIHPTAIIDPEAQIDPNVHIGPFCIIGKCVLEEGVQIMGLTKIFDNSIIKKNTIIESNCSIGAKGMAWIWDEHGKRIRQPQLGGVIIEEDCYLGTDITVVRGSMSEDSIIGAGTVIAHGTKIGHGTQVGKNVHMANNVSIAGNAIISERAFLGSACVVSPGIKISSNTIVGAGAVVNKNFEEEYLTIAGIPAKILKRKNYLSKPKGSPNTFRN